MKLPSLIRVFACAALIGPLLACSNDHGPPSYALRGDEPAPESDPSAEEERLHKMQLITVLDTQGNPHEINAFDLDEILVADCGAQSQACVWQSTCADLCSAQWYVCAAETSVALTRPQAVMPAIDVLGNHGGPYTVPVQTSSTVATIAHQGARWASKAGHELHGALKRMAGIDPPTSVCTADSEAAEAPGGRFAGPETAALFSRAFDLFKAAAAAEVQARLDVSDAELNSTSSPALAGERSIKTWRLAAARALGTTATELPFGAAVPNGAFCSRPPLTPDVKAAIAVFRDAAVDPEAILLESSTSHLLNIDGPHAPHGSVKQRLIDFYGSPGLSSGKLVEEQFNIDINSFEDARAYLRQELIAFSRSRTAVAATNRKRPDGTTSSYQTYVATSHAVGRMPPAYYGALVRAEAPDLSLWDSIDALPSLAPELPGEYGLTSLEFLHGAKQILAHGSGIHASVSEATVGPLAMLAAGTEVQGAVYYNSTYETLVVAGFGATEVWLAEGEDKLRCAVQGTIEGAPCTLDLTAFDAGEPRFGFAKSATRTGAYSEPRLYVVRLKNYVEAPQPGDYEALIGFDRGSGEGYQAFYPIIRGLDEKLAAILEPSADGCARPRLNCDGAAFDERIPLEDELTDDGNGAESSWRHYVDLARSAAERADALGADYVRAGIEAARRGEELELRTEQQRSQADAYLQHLQQLCGFTSDTRSLLDRITTPNGILTAGGQACTEDQDCSAFGDSLACDHSLPSDDGVCILDLTRLLDNTGADPDIQRIRDCLDRGTDTPFVSLGDQPLCLWYPAANRNLLCGEITEEGIVKIASPDDCPKQLLPDDGNPMTAPPTCEDTLTPPANSESVIVPTIPLGYFPMSVSSPGTQGDLYDQMRGAFRKGGLADFADEIRQKHVLDPVRLSDLIGGIDYTSLPGGYGAITYQGSPLYRTGELSTGFEQDPMKQEWPCNSTKNAPDRADRPYLCDRTATSEHDKARGALFRAVVAAKTLRPPTPDNKSDGDGHLLIPIASMEHGLTQHPGYWSTELETVALRDCTGSQSLVDVNLVGVMRNDCPAGTMYRGGDAGSSLFKRFQLRLEKQVGGRIINGSDGLSRYLLDFNGKFEPPKTELGNYLLARQGELTDDLATLRWDDFDARVPLATDGTQTIKLTTADYIRAIALIATVAGKRPKIELDQPPVVKGIEDLEGVSLYIAELATSIRDIAGSIVFANFPEKVASALPGEGASGAYPQFGGDMAVAISNARGAMLRIRENGPLVANEVQQLGADVSELKILLRKSAIGQELAGLQFLSTMQDRLTQCATAIASNTNLNPLGAAGNALAAAATCANSIAQIGIASDISNLQTEDAKLNGDLAVVNFGAKFSTHATAIQTLALHLGLATDDLNAALATIESIRSEARSALVNALTAQSFQAQQTAEISNSVGNLSTGSQLRYQDALRNARRLSFLAKRAVEQRLGVRLADLTEDYPLVEAPQKWEATACTFTGIDYAKLRTTDPDAPQSYQAGFIGEYVTKLENFVESYRLQHNFHEGTDTAVISLRDDLMNVRSDCLVEGPNLLYNAGQLDQTTQPGWLRKNCPMQTVGGEEEPAPGCVAIAPVVPGPDFVDKGIASTVGYTIAFGSASTANSAILQSVDLTGGLYRFTWYTQDDTGGGAEAGTVLGTSNVELGASSTDATTTGASWHRRYRLFSLTDPETVQIGFKKPTTGATNVRVSAPMLERLPDYPISMAFKPFVNTTDTSSQLTPSCVDTDGATFRSTRWTRNCTKLCPDGFADNCLQGRAVEYCYHQAEFGLSQRDIQLGKVFNFSGFARGNFNYRIDSVGLNFVGTGIRNCGSSEAPQPCYGGGFVPFSLSHQGPFFVRNHKGADVEAHVFDGNIEHARGLATERYVTNPLSDSDRSLIEQFTRREFSGRPLDGNFVLRVWEEDGVDFDAIEDVQIVLNYRYWTRFD